MLNFSPDFIGLHCCVARLATFGKALPRALVLARLALVGEPVLVPGIAREPLDGLDLAAHAASLRLHHILHHPARSRCRYTRQRSMHPGWLRCVALSHIDPTPLSFTVSAVGCQRLLATAVEHIVLGGSGRMGPEPNDIAGAAVCLVALFLPGLLLVVGALPFWDTFRTRRMAQAAMRGTNAAVVGILAAALYNPVWTSAILNARDFALALVGFFLLTAWNMPPWIVVVLLAAGGAALRIVA